MAKAANKTITADQRLKGLALFTMAADHYAKAAEFEAALADLLKIEDGPYCGCVSDEMVNGGNFDRGLKLEGFEIRKQKAKR